MFGKRKVEDISENDCRAYLDSLYEEDLETSTIRKHYETLHAFLTWCQKKKNIISSHPMKKIKKPIIKKGSETVAVFSLEELKRIIECSKNEPLMWQVMTIYHLILHRRCFGSKRKSLKYMKRHINFYSLTATSDIN